MSRFGIAIATWLFVTVPVNAQTDFFWSFADFQQGATNSHALQEFNVGESGSVFIYYSTINRDLDTGAGMDIFTSVSGVIEFTAAETFDFDIVLTQDQDIAIGVRWGDAFGPAGQVSTDEIVGLNAFTVVAGDGIVSSNNGAGPFLDTGYDFDSKSFQFARVDFDVVGSGSVSLDVQLAPGGICNNCGFLDPIFGNVTIIGVPEPSVSVLQLLLMLLLGNTMRKNRRHSY